ncbi:MAG TPA: hypothetical protein VEJ63_18660 [Planctomycetota bacterium]|nr:hypothetical protein [Planctomycetota bacterium]
MQQLSPGLKGVRFLVFLAIAGIFAASVFLFQHALKAREVPPEPQSNVDAHLDRSRLGLKDPPKQILGRRTRWATTDANAWRLEETGLKNVSFGIRSTTSDKMGYARLELENLPVPPYAIEISGAFQEALNGRVPELKVFVENRWLLGNRKPPPMPEGRPFLLKRARH